MNNIYFTDEFYQDIMNEENSIELTKFALTPFSKDAVVGKYIHPTTKEVIRYPSQLDFSYMEGSNKSPQNGYYTFEAISDRENGNIKLFLNTEGSLSNVLSMDQGIRNKGEKAYKVLYVLYSSSLTNSSIGSSIGGDKLAFIIYDRASKVGANELKLNPLNLSKHRNLINIDIPFKCEIMTRKDTDTTHLEGPGVNYANIYSISSDSNNSTSTTYIDRESYIRYYYNSVADNNPYYGGVNINKFGLRTY